MKQNITPWQHNQALARQTTPQMRYNGKEDFSLWQKRAKAKLAELLGLPFVQVDDNMAIEYTKQQEGYTEIRFTFQSEQGYDLPCHLLIPQGVSMPLPVVICLQGHSPGMHISLGHPRNDREKELIAGERDFCIQAVKEGYCALSIEQRNFGEKGGKEEGPDCYNSSMSAIMLGRTTIGERVWDIQRAIDVLAKHFPQTDPQQVVCMGNSGGGTATFYAACMDERIAYAIPSCAVCTLDDSIGAMFHCSCNYIPGIRKYFDMGDMAGLIAPRPLIIVAGEQDRIFPIDGVKSSYEKAKELYAAAGEPENVSLIIGAEGHRFYAAPSWAKLREYMQS